MIVETAFTIARIIASILEALSLRGNVIIGIDSFSHKFDKIVAESNHGNLVHSSFNTWIMLSTISDGAYGNTRQELSEALGTKVFEAGKVKYGVAKRNIMRSMPKEYINMTMKVFMNDRDLINTEFKDNLRKIYRQPSIYSVDLSNPQVAMTIDSWVDNWFRKQSGNFSEDIDNTDIRVKNRGIVIVDAINLKSFWNKRFSNTFTTKLEFQLQDGTTKKVRMMGRLDALQTGSLENIPARFAVLPWEDINNSTGMKLVVILPERDANVTDVENGVANIDVLDISRRKESAEVIWLRIPELRFKYTVDLTDSLKTFGLREMFKDRANFSGISETPIKISKVLQKVAIHLNEDGKKYDDHDAFTKFAGQTIKGFTVDRPFLLYVCMRDIVLLKARITDPNQE